MSFNNSAFINCPFDEEYKVLLRPLLFTVLYLDLIPKIAETESSGNIRVEQIKKHIRTSRYSIHDISRSDALQPGQLPRFNMPFELGMDIGCQSFGNTTLKNKRCLILDRERYRYQQVISDIAGQDIQDHNNNPQLLIKKVRNWIASSKKNHPPGPTVIWETYNQFYADMTENLSEAGFSAEDINSIPFSNFISLTKQWIAQHKAL